MAGRRRPTSRHGCDGHGDEAADALLAGARVEQPAKIRWSFETPPPVIQVL
jgi:hypothetical protein